jgi:ABC-2 type transport system permease protein
MNDIRSQNPAGAQPRPLYWSIRREVWENRSVYVAPLIVAAVVLFGSLIGTMTVAAKTHRSRLEPAKQRTAVSRPMLMAPAPIMLTTFLVGIFYALDALYGERRDRSILFWKSLPVSDATAVLAKASIPLLVLPLIAIALGIATQFLLLLMSGPALMANRINPARLGAEVFLAEPLIMLYGMTAHVLWFAPIYGWLLMISAWARRAPVLWAVVPPLAIMALERMAAGTSQFARLMAYRFSGAMTEAFAIKGHGGGDDIIRLGNLTPFRFLSAPGLWIGLVLTMLFLAAAVRLRRNREPI